MTKLTEKEIKDGWVKWDGEKRLIPKGSLVNVKIRSGEKTEYASLADIWSWKQKNLPGDIVAYKICKEGDIIKVPDGMDPVEFSNQLGNKEYVNHPDHYGGDTPYEAIKVIEAWELGFCLGNTIKYISRAGKKGDALEDLKKAKWYLDREISKLENKNDI